MNLKKYKAIRICSILLIILIIVFNLMRFTMANEATVAKMTIELHPEDDTVYSEEIDDDDEYNCYVLIKISSQKKIKGIRFKLYLNNQFKMIAAESLTDGGGSKNLKEGIFAITYNGLKDFKNETEIYKIYIKKKLKTNNVAINEENLNLHFNFNDIDTSEIVTEDTTLTDGEIDYPKGKNEDVTPPDNPSDNDNNDNTGNNGDNSGGDSGSSSGGGSQTIVKDDGTTITTIVDEKAGTITTITTDGKTGEQTTNVEKITSSTANKKIPKTNDSISILSIISIIILSIIATISRRKLKVLK